MATYQERRAARKLVAYAELYGASQIVIGLKQGSYPPLVTVDLTELELRLLAGRDPYGEDA